MDLITYDYGDGIPHHEEGLGWVFTAATTATSLLGGIFGGRNKQKVAEADARLARNTAQLNSRYQSELNNLKRIEENIKKAQIEIRNLDQENDAIVAETGKMIQKKTIQVKGEKKAESTKKIVIGTVSLVVLSGIIYKVYKNRKAA